MKMPFGSLSLIFCITIETLDDQYFTDLHRELHEYRNGGYRLQLFTPYEQVHPRYIIMKL